MRAFLFAALFFIHGFMLQADEGIWLFNQPPSKFLRDRYHFDATDAWLEHLQKSSVRFDSGGSGSFVSEDGLIISNHHVGADAIQKLGTEDKNYLRDGFYARTHAEELKCLDLELDVLESIEDVTARVNTAVLTNANASSAVVARRKIIAEIEKESLDRTGLRSDIVTLWEGGAYQLYRYKSYTDVRLVFAPEQQIADYGGDPDNFEYPRYDLDICLFRAYENGQPAKVKDFLKFSPAGAHEGDLVFTSGHPAYTSRFYTVADLESQRDVVSPFLLEFINRREALLANWSARSEENARRAKEDLFGMQNERKRQEGQYDGLLDPDLFTTKAKIEANFKAQLVGKPEFTNALAAYDKIAGALTTLKIQSPFPRYMLLENAFGFDCDSFGIARTLLRASEERPKPNGERLREFSDSNKASLELALFSTKPIYTDYEILKLADSLTFMVEHLGMNDPLIQNILAGQTPRERAAKLITDTKVRDMAFRKTIYDGGASAVSTANDPMIELARLIDPESRALRKVGEGEGEIIKQGYEAITQAKTAFLGTAGYPDATFTLRLAFGTVKGYEEDGQQKPAFTTFGGLYKRANENKNHPPFDLPPLWQKRKSHLDLNTSFNFVCTCDNVGGSSGSPVVNRAGEFVGIIFDTNLQGIPWNYAFNDQQGRSIAVESTAILETLDKVYRAKILVQELMRGQRRK
jgi:hypothetical protein